MYTPEKVIKRTLLVSLLLHGILFLVLEKKFQDLNTIEAVPLSDIMVSLVVKSDLPSVAPPIEMIQPDPPKETPPEPEVEKVLLEETPAEEPHPVEKDETVIPAETADSPAEIDAAELSDPVAAEATSIETGAPAAPVEPLYTGTRLDSLNLEGARMPAPSYPSKAKRMEWEGDVTVSFVINCKGRVESITLEDSSGYDILDETVMRTVSRAWRFPKRDEAAHVWKTFAFRLIS